MGSLRAHKRPRASRKKDAGTLCLVICSATIPPGLHRKEYHESERAKYHNKFEVVNAFQHFKRATRIETLSEDHPQLRRQVHIPSGALSAADPPSHRISRLLYYQKEISDIERRNILRIVYQPSDLRNPPDFRSPGDSATGLSESRYSYISYWAEQKIWPKEYFEQNSMHYLIARQKSTASLRRKRSETSFGTSVTPSNQTREEKSAPYSKINYPTLLELLGDSYIKKFCQSLLEKKHPTPKNTLFRDNVFTVACANLQGKNETRIIVDIARLLLPSPEALVAFGSEHLDILVESVNEGWNNSIPVTNPRPQPDFSIGFRRSIFSDDQLRKLQPLLDDPSSNSHSNTLASICSVIDELPPDFNLETPQPSAQQLSEHSGLSQQLGDRDLTEVPDSRPSHAAKPR
ncbi:hypothetical protein MMC31_002382 [Peltigera leucophlebia]|nr:hypothetical protein [Peltigera leucophlebia]